MCVCGLHGEEGLMVQCGGESEQQNSMGTSSNTSLSKATEADKADTKTTETQKNDGSDHKTKTTGSKDHSKSDNLKGDHSKNNKSSSSVDSKNDSLAPKETKCATTVVNSCESPVVDVPLRPLKGCGVWQHARCMAVTDIGEPYYCHRCQPREVCCDSITLSTSAVFK